MAAGSIESDSSLGYDHIANADVWLNRPGRAHS